MRWNASHTSQLPNTAAILLIPTGPERTAAAGESMMAISKFAMFMYLKPMQLLCLKSFQALDIFLLAVQQGCMHLHTFLWLL